MWWTHQFNGPDCHHFGELHQFVLPRHTLLPSPLFLVANLSRPKITTPKWKGQKRALPPCLILNGTLQPLPPLSPSLSAEISFDISQSQIQSFLFEFDVSGNLRRLKEFLHKSDNRTCADCGASDPKWASANIGVFICLKCCGVHRSLGTHISKVLSVTLDEWSDEEIDNMIEVGGNSSANAIYEAHLEGSVKPSPDSSHEERMHFIRSKYELQEFLKPSLRIVSLSSAGNSIYSSDSGNNLNSFRVSNKSKSEQVAMVEFIGILKVKVIEGRNLAVRDFLSSDPYVVVSIGQQKAQTTVMKSNLNPVWKEDLMLSVPQNYGALKLQVFDHDTFSADDIMGEAEVDIQPLVTAATAFVDVSMFGNMQIGKWLKTSDNALIRDSIINIIDGMVKQEVSLKLQNVESGELEIELEWLPLEQ
ncbi:putative ADP-ribosylation factor GTPase-activating protein AGD13 [Cinnamomum micranthum f. kanehirae]|uniref:Putative ADP-ribosylation factor GTPase-activating protein AGD13 n=1 Tax=Cinnamomum micranthum f. kanehirae TaxID=337451 RepID=A0A3S4NUJ9_9MAGN|nr:putative ADP-ribosylation factor GTPase-activating protein AGD13 [Cinnamomum micranthum f. kanehirae]